MLSENINLPDVLDPTVETHFEAILSEFNESLADIVSTLQTAAKQHWRPQLDQMAASLQSVQQFTADIKQQLHQINERLETCQTTTETLKKEVTSILDDTQSMLNNIKTSSGPTCETVSTQVSTCFRKAQENTQEEANSATSDCTMSVPATTISSAVLQESRSSHFREASSLTQKGKRKRSKSLTDLSEDNENVPQLQTRSAYKGKKLQKQESFSPLGKKSKLHK